MRALAWRSALALAQVVAAMAAFIYAPYQYKARPHPIGDDSGLVGYRMTWPPPVVRISYALNFPALAASIPVRYLPGSAQPVIYRENPYISLSVDDSVFLLGVGVLWYWLGGMVHRGGREHAVGRSGLARLLRSAAGTVFSLGAAALALFYATRTDADRPFRQVGPFCVVWAAAMLYYFGRNLVLAIRAPIREINNWPERLP